MASTKRAWKLQEFVAHPETVNCLALGHKTGRVMVTGGDDRKVNLWTVGKPNCIMSLSGHTSPVEAVHFGNAEEMVVAGSRSGALKIWDLEQAKIIRTLTGHKANIRCLDFHPYGDFVASGSLDTNVKLWDIRRKGCIFTYKGHSNGVNDLRFSPDGRWVASAGEDSIIKIWDLAAGKLLVDLKQHMGPVTGIEFHPSEYLLASSSSDRTIHFWELEKFQCVDSTACDSSGIRTICFHPDGQCIFGGIQDMVKVYGWEPSRCFDSVTMGWGKVADMAIAQTQLIGATINQTNVSTFVLDLSKVAPIGEVPVDSPPTPLSSSGRRNYLTERPPTRSTKAQIPNTQKKSSNRQVVSSSSSSVDRKSGSRSPSLSKRQSVNASGSTVPLRRSSSAITMNYSCKNVTLRNSRSDRPSSVSDSASSKVSKMPRPLSCADMRVVTSLPSERKLNNNNSKTRKDNNKVAEKIIHIRELPVVNITPKSAVEKPAEEPEEVIPTSDDPGDDANSTADVQDPKEYEQVFKPKTKLASSPPKQMDPFPAPKDEGVSRLEKNFSQMKAAPSVIPQERDKPVGLDPNDFLPKQPVNMMPHKPAAVGDYDAVTAISKGHSSMSALLTSRNQNLQIVRAMWSSGNIKTALDSAIQMNDQSVIVDILNVLNFKPGYWTLDAVEHVMSPIRSLLHSKYEAREWTLDVVTSVLPIIKSLINAKYESYVHVGCCSLKVVLKNFSHLIKQNLHGPPGAVGVDITGEERRRKCRNIYNLIQEVRQAVDGKQYQQGKMGSTFKEINLLLGNLDS